MNRSALERLETFVGRWTLAADFAHMPGVEMSGSSEFRWILRGAFLLMTAEVAHPQAPVGHSLIGLSNHGDAYTQHYFDSRGVIRTYEMTFDGTTWTLTREKSDFTPLDFKQRFVGTFEDGGDTIRGQWEIDQGEGYVRDFGVIYRRER